MHMKKFTLFFILFFFIAFANAQINRGTIFLGGGVSANNNKSISPSSVTNSHGLSIFPSIGLAVKENIVFGIKGGYGYGKTKYSIASVSEKDRSYSGGVFLRRYLALGKGFYLFGEAEAIYFHRKNDQLTGIDEQSHLTQKVFQLSLNPGLAYAVNNIFHLEISLNELVHLDYNKTKRENIFIGGSTQEESKGFYFNSNASSASAINIGFRFVFAK